MLAPLKEKLSTVNIYLATESKPRKQVLKDMGLEEIIKCKGSGADEVVKKEDYKTSEEYVTKIAIMKVDGLEKRLKEDRVAWDVLIGADTIVDIDGEILHKPKNEEEGRKHLSRLSKRDNAVVTGVAIRRQGCADTETFVEKTTVTFGKLTEAQIREYAATKQSQSCAGAYAIQGGAGTFIKKIDGNYFSIMGLPIHGICSRLYEMYSSTENITSEPTTVPTGEETN